MYLTALGQLAAAAIALQNTSINITGLISNPFDIALRKLVTIPLFYALAVLIAPIPTFTTNL